MKRLLAICFYQQLNAVLVSLYLLHLLEVGEVLVLQVLYFCLLVHVVLYQLRKNKNDLSILKRRAKWIGFGLVALVFVSLILNAFSSKLPTNQVHLIQAQKEVPVLSFLLFLVNASLVEEFLYREILWKFISKLDVRFALTTVLFALSHHPSSIIAWCLYGVMGLVLGLVRHKTDLVGSMCLHLIWNMLVFVILM